MEEKKDKDKDHKRVGPEVIYGPRGGTQCKLF